MSSTRRYGRTRRCGRGLLDREAHHRQGRVQSLAGAAGGALHPSVHRHGLWLQRVLAAAVARARRHRSQDVSRHDARAGAFHDHLRLARRQLGWMFTLFFVVLGVSAAIWGGWLERVGPRKAGVVAALLLVRRPRARRDRRLHPSALADVARLRRDRRHRAWPRLHLAGLDPDQMVSRPARHGDRHGHHGLRRRRHDRLAARRSADELFQDADLGRRLADVPGHGRDLFRLHDGRRVRLSRAAGRLAAGGLDAAGEPRR